MTSSRLRAAELKRRRSEVGLTQQRLADLADLSVRTVRGLENGTVPTPHLSSLARIVAALGLDSTARLDFLSAWGREDHSEFAAIESIYAEHRPGVNGLRAAVRARAASLDSLALLSRVVVGPGRRIQSRDREVVVIARVDGVAGQIDISEPTSNLRLDLIDIDQVDACRVLRARTLPHLGVKVFDLDFGKTLSRGDTHSFRYRIDYRRATEAIARSVDAGEPLCVDLTGDGFYRTVPIYSLRVQFDPHDVPKRCVRIYRARPGAEITELERIPVSAWSAVQLNIQDAKPGNHGLRWEW